MKILAVNAGSSSVRLRAYDIANGSIQCLWSWHNPVFEHDPQQTLEHIIAKEQAAKFDVAVHRLVHGGTAIVGPTFVDDQSKTRIQDLVPLAPLHNSVCLAWLNAAEIVLGPQTRQVVVPDTGFYAGLPERAWRYALPAKLCEELGIRRFGFHGLAHKSMMRTWHAMASPADPERARLVSLQLGAGCSITATLGRTPVDTSMGYTPLEGLVMATRAGDVDPGIILHLVQTGLDAARISDVLNHESGLRGVSRLSGDMQELLSASEAEARLAVEIYCYRARKYVGAYLSALGGADAILFGGGVGENSPAIRARTLEGMNWCGIEIDESLNQLRSFGTRKISRDCSQVAVWVVQVDEERLMAEAAYSLVQGSVQPTH